MKLTFIESAKFSSVREDLFKGDEEYCKFQNDLMNNPHAGTPMPGTPGVRKVRVASEKQGKGKRGGIRVLYLYIEAISYILLIDAYTKNEAENPSPKQMKAITQLADKERSQARQSDEQEKSD